MLSGKASLLVLPVLLFAWTLSSQELYPLSEPASSVPKGVVGLRVISEQYKEVNTVRSLQALRVMYGLTAKLSVMATASVSNHHNRQLPPDLINHTHVGSQTIYYTQNFKRGVEYPFLYNGLHLYAKYRFLTFDKKNEHLRVAAYGEWSNVGVAHDETEPDIMEDTGGYGYGLIITWLKNRFAASLNTGIEKPKSYFEYQPDLTGGPDLPTKVFYGDALQYTLSLGYRKSPGVYTDYEQPNTNLYVEFVGKAFQTAKVYQAGEKLKINTVALKGNTYLEIHPGIQRVINSNLRIEVSGGFSVISKSYAHFTPVWTVGIQRYFY